ncbi:HNH endonuclease [Spirosoma knui]
MPGQQSCQSCLLIIPPPPVNHPDTMPTVNRPVRPWLKQATKKADRWKKKPTGDIPVNFYRLAKWRRLRASVLERQPLCVHCKQERRLTSATVVDHIVPIRLGGGPLDESNLMPLCQSCHQRKSAKERHECPPGVGKILENGLLCEPLPCRKETLSKFRSKKISAPCKNRLDALETPKMSRTNSLN